jgi:hypothetical protein
MRFALPLVLVIGAIAFSLLLGEAALRLAGYAPRIAATHPEGYSKDDPLMGWINRAGVFPSNEPGNVPMTFLSDGRRFDPADDDKSSDLHTVLFVGDSFTQGYGVADDEVYVHLVNLALPSLRTLNYGTGGYSTFQSLLRMRAYFTTAPAKKTPIIVYGLIGAHLERNVSTPDWIFAISGVNGAYYAPPHVRVSGDRFVEKMGGTMPLWPLEGTSAAVALAHRSAISVIFAASSADQQRAMKLLLLTMRQVAEDHGARFITLGLMAVPPWLPAWTNSAGIAFADCHIDRYEQGYPEFHIGGTGSHPNGLGHRQFASCALEALGPYLSAIGG